MQSHTMDSTNGFPIQLAPLQTPPAQPTDMSQLMTQYMQQMQQLQQTQRQMYSMMPFAPFMPPPMAWMPQQAPVLPKDPVPQVLPKDPVPQVPHVPQVRPAEPTKAPIVPQAADPAPLTEVLTPAKLAAEEKPIKAPPPYSPPRKRENPWTPKTTDVTPPETLICHSEFPKRYPVGIDPRKSHEFKWLQSVVEKHKIKFTMKSKGGVNKNCSFKNESFPHFTFCVNYVENSKDISCIIFYDDRHTTEYDGLIVRMVEFYDEGGVRRYSIYDPASKHYHVALYTRDTGELYKLIEKTKLNSFNKEDIIEIKDVLPKKHTI